MRAAALIVLVLVLGVIICLSAARLEQIGRRTARISTNRNNCCRSPSP